MNTIPHREDKCDLVAHVTFLSRGYSRECDTKGYDHVPRNTIPVIGSNPALLAFSHLIPDPVQPLLCFFFLHSQPSPVQLPTNGEVLYNETNSFMFHEYLLMLGSIDSLILFSELIIFSNPSIKESMTIQKKNQNRDSSFQDIVVIPIVPTKR